MTRSREARRREENEIEFARIVAFSDGVFAIAITLLVLNLGVPEHIKGDDLDRALWEQRQDLFAYALSFAVIGRFWLIHHRFFSDITGFDGRLLALNLFYLAWIVLIPFSSQVLGDHGGDTAAVVLYAANLAGVVLVGSLMLADARRSRPLQDRRRGGGRIPPARVDHRRRLPGLDSGGADRGPRRPIRLAGALRLAAGRAGAQLTPGRRHGSALGEEGDGATAGRAGHGEALPRRRPEAGEAARACTRSARPPAASRRPRSCASR